MLLQGGNNSGRFYVRIFVISHIGFDSGGPQKNVIKCHSITSRLSNV